MAEFRYFLGIIIMIIGVILGLYVGGWWMFVVPIITCCEAYDAGVLTASMIGWSVIKCILAGFVGRFIYVVITAIGKVVAGE